MPDLLWLGGNAALQAAGAGDAGGGDGAAALPEFDVLAYSGGVISPAGVPNEKDPVKRWVIDCAGVISPARISAVVDHGRASWSIFGQTIAVRIARDAIRMRVRVTGDPRQAGSAAEVVCTNARNGFQWPVSLGAHVVSSQFVPPGALVSVNGQTFEGPLHVALAVELYHIAFVTDGADRNAVARLAAQARRSRAQTRDTEMDFHTWLIKAGFKPEDLDETQRASLQAAFDREKTALQTAGGDGGLNAGAGGGDGGPGAGGAGRGDTAIGDPVQTGLAAQRAENQRRMRISQLCGQFAEGQPDSVLDQIQAAGERAIRENWSHERLENQLLRATASRPVRNQPASGGAAAVAPEVLECAFARTMGMPNVEQVYSAQTLEAASRRFRYGLAIGELLMMGAAANGLRGLHTIKGNLRGVLQAAMRRDEDGLEASGGSGSAGSTLNISNVLSNVANKTVEQYFNSVEQTWKLLCRIASASDFKEQTHIALTGDLTFTKLTGGKTIEHGSVGEEVYGNKVDTFARMLGISRTDLINDDAGALLRVYELLGRGGALSLNREFWTEFNNDSAFCTSGRENLLSGGAATALSPTSLDAAAVALRKMKDPKQNPIGLPGKVLAVPIELEFAALRLMQSMDLRELQASSGASAKAYGTANVHRGKYTVAASAYMGDTTIGGSTTAWKLLTDPNLLPSIEVAFYNGVQMPTVESTEANFNQLGIDLRAFFDFGVRKQEYRAVVKAPGA